MPKAPTYGSLPRVADPAARDNLRALLDRMAQIEELVRSLQAASLQATNRQAINAKDQWIQFVRDPQYAQDAVNLRTLQRELQILNADIAAGEGEGGDPNQGAGSDPPTVPLPDGLGLVLAYANAHPAELADSCQSSGGSWDFMDGLVAFLQGHDERYGFLGQRSNPDDLAEDAITYYHGALPPIEGSLNTYGFDVISGHCGPSPSAAFQNVTDPQGAGAAWVGSRT